MPVLEIKNFEKENVVTQSSVQMASKEELELYRSGSDINLSQSAYIFKWLD